MILSRKRFHGWCLGIVIWFFGGVIIRGNFSRTAEKFEKNSTPAGGFISEQIGMKKESPHQNTQNYRAKYASTKPSTENDLYKEDLVKPPKGCRKIVAKKTSSIDARWWLLPPTSQKFMFLVYFASVLGFFMRVFRFESPFFSMQFLFQPKHRQQRDDGSRLLSHIEQGGDQPLPLSKPTGRWGTSTTKAKLREPPQGT